MNWQPNEALRYMVESFHSHEYWSDATRTHSREFADCPDEMCVAARRDLAAIETEVASDAR